MRIRTIIEKIIDVSTILIGLFLLLILPFQLPIEGAGPVELLGIAYIVSGSIRLISEKEENP